MKTRSYTKEEKLHHVKQAEAFAASGAGSIRAYAQAVGIPKNTLYSWMHKHRDRRSAPAAVAAADMFVKLGKVHQAPASTANPITVEYCGARIEVTSKQDLVTVLSGIREAGAI